MSSMATKDAILSVGNLFNRGQGTCRLPSVDWSRCVEAQQEMHTHYNYTILLEVYATETGTA